MFFFYRGMRYSLATSSLGNPKILRKCVLDLFKLVGLHLAKRDLLLGSKTFPATCRYVFWYHNNRMVNYDKERGINVYTSTSPTGEKTKWDASLKQHDDVIGFCPAWHSFCSTSLPLASTRCVRSTFSSHCLFSPKQRCWLTSATSTFFSSEKISGMLGIEPRQLWPQARMITIVLCWTPLPPSPGTLWSTTLTRNNLWLSGT